MVSGIEIAEEFATEFYPLHEAANVPTTDCSRSAGLS